MPESQPKIPKPTMPTSWIMAIFGSIVLFGLVLGFAVSSWKSNTNNANQSGNTNSTNTVSDANANIAYENTNVEVLPENQWTVDWSGPTKVDSLHVLPQTGSEYNLENPCDGCTPAAYYQIGTLTSGPYIGDNVYLVAFQEEGPVFYPTFIRFIRHENTNIVLKVASSHNYYETEMEAAGTVIDRDHTLYGLRLPDTFSGPDARQTLHRDTFVNALFDQTGLDLVFTDPTLGPVYTQPGGDPTEELLGKTTITERNGFYVRALDGTLGVYYYIPDVFTIQDPTVYNTIGVFNATWTSGEKNTSEYNFTVYGGCGPRNYAYVVTDIVSKDDLTQVGTTVQGDPVYGWRDTEATRLHEFYDETYVVFDNSKLAYSDFVQQHPLVYWTDPFGRLIELSNADFRPQAECGKPVIYLYPTYTQSIQVDLRPVGGFSVTVPAYERGWNIIARPDGTLINKADGKTYPYLFWEGQGGIYETPQQGFVITQASVHQFLQSSLRKLGLNLKESADFIDFWEPRMQGSPYYFVTFSGRSVMDQLAPLTVTPEPDTIIRILMDFQPLDRPVPVESLRLTAPVRHGFTVVEWGGVLR